MHELFTVTDAARLLHRSSDAIRLYERTGKLKAQRTAGGMRLFRRAELERFQRERRAQRAVGERAGLRDGEVEP